jgi:hypothetical protein
MHKDPLEPGRPPEMDIYVRDNGYRTVEYVGHGIG